MSIHRLPLRSAVCASFGFALLCSDAKAQITTVGTVPEHLLVTRSLPTAGIKLYSTQSNSLTLYDLDLSVHTTINYPALPTGYTYFGVLYITESTFDTDPLSIELMMLTTGPGAVSGTRVFRDDGTILLDELDYGFSGTGGYDQVNAKPPLFADHNGVAYLVLTTYPTNPPTSSKLFQLPGTVPCIECATGAGLGIRPLGNDTGGGSLRVFPNPSNDQINIAVELAEGAISGRLLVHDTQGKLVMNMPVNTSGTVVVPMHGRAAGNYSCVLLSGDKVSRTEPFILLH